MSEVRQHEEGKVALTARVLILPLVLGSLGAYFNYRLSAQKQAAEAGYGVVAPAVKDLQEQVKSLTTKMDLLTVLIPKLAYDHTEHTRTLTPVPPASLNLLHQFQRTPSRRLWASPPPSSLDAAASMK